MTHISTFRKCGADPLLGKRTLQVRESDFLAAGRESERGLPGSDYIAFNHMLMIQNK